MSGATPDTAPPAAGGAVLEAEAELPRGGRRGPLLVGGLGVLIATVAAVAAIRSSGGSSESPPIAPGSATQTSLATVERGPLSAQITQSGTLGYAAKADGEPYQVVNRSTGAYTVLPTTGEVIDCGRTLYRVEDNPVVLLCGHTPMYRTLSQGMSGPDVRDLNRNLVALGYATRSKIDPDSDEFTWQTRDALKKLQDHLGVDETGTLAPADAVSLPGPLRITKVTATGGADARPGTPIATATSTRRQVHVDIDASQAAGVKVGDRAQVTLPSNTTTPGRVSRIGTVASADSGSGSVVKVPIFIVLKSSKGATGLDEAPVQVQVTTDAIKDALSVPVTALIALAGGGYAVEAVAPGGSRTVVPVKLGIFDHANGRVQVTGSDLGAGQRVVVPAT